MGLLSSGIAGIQAGNVRTEKAMGNYFPPTAPVQAPVQAQPRVDTSDIYGRGLGYQTNADKQRALTGVAGINNPRFRFTERKQNQRGVRDAFNAAANQGITYQNSPEMMGAVNKYLDYKAPQRNVPVNGGVMAMGNNYGY